MMQNQFVYEEHMEQLRGSSWDWEEAVIDKVDSKGIKNEYLDLSTDILEID